MMARSARSRARMPRFTATAIARKPGCGCGRCSSAEAQRSPVPAAAPAFNFAGIPIFPDRSAATRTLFPTAEGTETVSRTLDPAGGGAAGPGPRCSSGVKSGAFSTIPAPRTIAAQLTGNKLGTTFNMDATFVPNQAGCDSSCGEYRQYIRGRFTSNGSPVVHHLCGSVLDPSAYQEDCANIGGRTYKYGYHSNAFATSRFDNPDQLNGLSFHGEDAPGITGNPGDHLAVQLDFRGQLVDACNGDRVMQTAEWSVAGSDTVP